MQTCTILYAEDEANDVLFFELALKKASLPYALVAVPDGAEAIEYLAAEEQHSVPDLVLLDINMPKRSGLEVLEWIRQQPRFESVPVLMLTSSSRPEDMEKAQGLGANDYLLKPSDPLKLVEVVAILRERWLSRSIGAPNR